MRTCCRGSAMMTDIGSSRSKEIALRNLAHQLILQLPASDEDAQRVMEYLQQIRALPFPASMSRDAGADGGTGTDPSGRLKLVAS
jgi:hypothetical protein